MTCVLKMACSAPAAKHRLLQTGASIECSADAYFVLPEVQLNACLPAWSRCPTQRAATLCYAAQECLLRRGCQCIRPRCTPIQSLDILVTTTCPQAQPLPSQRGTWDTTAHSMASHGIRTDRLTVIPHVRPCRQVSHVIHMISLWEQRVTGIWLACTLTGSSVLPSALAACICLSSPQLTACVRLQAGGLHLPQHGRLPPGMPHQYMASPHIWPAQAAVRLPPQQPTQAQVPQQTQQHQPWQADPQWQPPSHRQNRQEPMPSPLTGRSGNLSRQHSGENTSRRYAHSCSTLQP